jgi:hypothetical protein
VIHAGDQKRIFNANWISRPSLALVILPTVLGLLMLLPEPQSRDG